MTEQTKPETLTNARGFEIPISEIKPHQLLKDELVKSLLVQAKELSKQHDDFKRKAFSEVHDLIGEIASTYGVKNGGDKGNVSLSSYDNRSKVQIRISEDIAFGDEIKIAKQLISEVVEGELESSSNFIREIVRSAFQTNHQGEYNKARIMELRRYRDSNSSEKWINAMRALDDAIIASDSKVYLAFLERNKYGKWIQIPLVSKNL